MKAQAFIIVITVICVNCALFDGRRRQAEKKGDNKGGGGLGLLNDNKDDSTKDRKKVESGTAKDKSDSSRKSRGDSRDDRDSGDSYGRDRDRDSDSSRYGDRDRDRDSDSSRYGDRDRRRGSSRDRDDDRRDSGRGGRRGGLASGVFERKRGESMSKENRRLFMERYCSMKYYDVKRFERCFREEFDTTFRRSEKVDNADDVLRICYDDQTPQRRQDALCRNTNRQAKLKTAADCEQMLYRGGRHYEFEQCKAEALEGRRGPDDDDDDYDDDDEYDADADLYRRRYDGTYPIDDLNSEATTEGGLGDAVPLGLLSNNKKPAKPKETDAADE